MDALRFLLVGVLLVILSCGQDEEVRMQLTPAQRDAYQDIAAERIEVMRPIMDSLCKVTFEDRVAVATDSIVQRQLEEEVRLRARVEQMRDQ